MATKKKSSTTDIESIILKVLVIALIACLAFFFVQDLTKKSSVGPAPAPLSEDHGRDDPVPQGAH